MPTLLLYMKLYSKTSQQCYLEFTKIKLKCLKKKEVPGLLIRSGKLCQLYISYLSIILGETYKLSGTYRSLTIQWINPRRFK